MLGSLILYLKSMRTMMFQLSGFYYTSKRATGYLVHCSTTEIREFPKTGDPNIVH